MTPIRCACATHGVTCACVVVDLSPWCMGHAPCAFDACSSREIHAKEETMLSLTVTLLIIAIIAAVLGFGGLAGTAVGFAKIAFFVFIILALLSFVFRGGRGTVA
jgi:uncharacterized membrane protein YtjA (UPF0391 family)